MAAPVTGSLSRGLVSRRAARLTPVLHGSVAATELAPLGLSPADVLDFSVNTNPLGPAASVLEAIAGADWSRYPGDDERPLRERLAECAGLSTEQVALGNGSAELLWLLCLATLEPGDRVEVVGPSFGEYAHAARAVGAEVIEVQRLAEVSTSAHLVFVCNPNNPTAEHRPREAIENLLAAAPSRIVALDEAYAAFDPRRWPSARLLARFPNLVVLRSMTKDQALPGLRLGHALASRPVAAALEAVRPPWSVNAGALRAGLAALEPAAEQHLERARSVVAESRERLTAGLRALGIAVQESSANFVLAEVGDGAAFRRALLPRGLVVRDAASFGLPRHVRIACLRPSACERLLEQVHGVLADRAAR